MNTIFKKQSAYIGLTTLFTIMMTTSSLYANQPSFDCTKVEKNSTEGIICSSDTLMDLDKELSKIYKQALEKAPKEDMLKTYQRGWIKGRNECWKENDEKKCIEESYQTRIKELKEKYQLQDENKEASTISNKFDKTLSLQGITFHVSATNGGPNNQLTITPKGLEIDNSVIEQKIDGRVTETEIADINADGFPEIYIFITSAGSGSYGSVVGYSSNHNKSITPIYMAPLEYDKKNSVGYMGHDEFTIIENSLARRFPVYNEDDPNCCPKGGMRQLQYKLFKGEATWQLKIINSTSYENN